MKPKSPKKKIAASRNVSNGKPRKPKKTYKTNRANRRTRDISVSKDLYSKLVRRSAVESTAAGHSISASKLVDRIMTEFLDGLEVASRITPEDERSAAKIVVGGFVLKDRGVEGPFIHVDARGRMTRAGLPGSTLAIAPPAKRFENSHYDPTPAPVVTDEDVFDGDSAGEAEEVAAQQAEEDSAHDAAGDEEFGESNRG